MSKEHKIYWLSTEESGEDGIGENHYYFKSARTAAQQYANKTGECVYINQGDDIVDVIYPANKPEEKLGYNILLDRAEREGVSQEAVNTLLRYYTETLGWGMNEALNYTIELFDNGTIAQIKALNGKETNG